MNKGSDIVEELKSMDSFLAQLPNGMPYSVPENYFENLDNKLVVNSIYAGERFESALPDQQPFTVPAGYFEALPAHILQAAKATENKEIQIIPFKRRNLFRSVKWAAAAIVVLGLGLGSYQLFFNGQPETHTDKMLSAIPATEIQDYLQHIYRVDINRIVTNSSISDQKLDNKEIIQYLDETGWD